MAITVSKKTIRQVKAGQNGYKLVSGQAAFSTTDTTGTINTGLTTIEGVQLTIGGTPTAAETLFASYSGGTLTVSRVGAAVASGLTFFFDVKGY